MATRIKLTREDIMAGKAIAPAWYLSEIKEVTQKPSKTDGSTNTWVKFMILEGPNTGVMINKNYSEKFMAGIVGLIEALTGKPYVEDTEIDLDSAIGKKVRIKVKNNEYQGRMQNDVEGYKAA